jgi:hypothetical protein
MEDLNEALSPASKSPWLFNGFAIGVHWGSVVVLALVAALGFYMTSNFRSEFW